jgi:methylmalonyl-CoA mutase cobalamin-binding subunit
MAKVVIPNAHHEAFYQDLCALMKKHCDEHNLSDIELLALVSQSLGGIIAGQDQRKYTSAGIMEMVAKNIEMGNQRFITETFKDPKGHG